MHGKLLWLIRNPVTRGKSISVALRKYIRSREQNAMIVIINMTSRLSMYFLLEMPTATETYGVYH